ncbi:hypothetical protein Ccar_03190 [Clostridium carboxidivorans P7]|uniref:Uncharacterized protein n=1 Tax=Clostridium carboxidivorans P7 TaxID=536227 RepID=C6PMN1_9CLOT|nr:hypothetical protein [Clostridium carboxidivorans]AKN29898.1 hypothetical protein Ccar_03190 [Clostridium carboxidivorans P7]EET89430.1 hypothetical protein CcarbDRAFT_0019 [Clostridium carboxidivorans P7]
MEPIKLKSSWLNKCLMKFFNKEVISQEDLDKIKYLHLSSTYEECMISLETPPKRVIHPNSGDQWCDCCDWNVENSKKLDNLIKIDKYDYIYNIALINEEADVEDETAEKVEIETSEFEKSITNIGELVEVEDEDYISENDDDESEDNIIFSEDLKYFRNLEELRLSVCSDIYSLGFLNNMPNLRILELSEVQLKDNNGFENLLNLKQLSIWGD